MYWNQTSAPVDSNFIQNYEYYVICTLLLMYLHPSYFTDARTLKYEDFYPTLTVLYRNIVIIQNNYFVFPALIH